MINLTQYREDGMSKKKNAYFISLLIPSYIFKMCLRTRPDPPCQSPPWREGPSVSGGDGWEAAGPDSGLSSHRQRGAPRDSGTEGPAAGSTSQSERTGDGGPATHTRRSAGASAHGVPQTACSHREDKRDECTSVFISTQFQSGKEAARVC